MTFNFISVKIESIEYIFSQTKSIYLNCENYEIKKFKKKSRQNWSGATWKTRGQDEWAIWV